MSSTEKGYAATIPQPSIELRMSYSMSAVLRSGMLLPGEQQQPPFAIPGTASPLSPYALAT
eukprot:473169-Rhodomonas_salina.6